jgi:dihydropteroate synthase
MQRHVHFDDLFGEIADELALALARALAAGITREQIVLDPGIGFGKSGAQSAALVGASEFLQARCGRPVLIGASRKRFLGTLAGDKPVEERQLASVVAAVLAAAHGAAVVRVHDVAQTVEALRVAAGIEAALASALSMRA